MRHVEEHELCLNPKCSSPLQVISLLIDSSLKKSPLYSCIDCQCNGHSKCINKNICKKCEHQTDGELKLPLEATEKRFPFFKLKFSVTPDC